MTGAEEPSAKRSSFSRDVGIISFTNAAVYGVGLVTGPILARALEPSGRGTYASVTVVLSLAPLVVGLGLGAFAGREAARGTPTRVLTGSLLPVYLVIGLVVAFAADPLARFVAGGNARAAELLGDALMVVPALLVTQLGFGVAHGQRRWGLIAAHRLATPVVGLTGVTLLWLTGNLTVGSAVLVFVLTSLLGGFPLWIVLATRRPRSSQATLRAGVSFGARSWVASLAATGSVRLDQVLMIGLTSARQLGLYAVAVTLASIPTVATGAVQGALMPRVAAGDESAIAAATRITLFAVAVVSAALAAIAPLLLPLLFGHQFAPAVPMALILLIAAIPLAGLTVLAGAVESAGHPGIAATAQTISLGLSLALLPLVLPAAGGTGAALVSVLAYSANFIWLMRFAASRSGVGLTHYLIVRHDDVQWLKNRVDEVRRRRSS